jgi:Tfp pilus assembly protein FimT
MAELMVTVLILGLIAAFSVPAVNRYLAGWNLQASRNTVISELKLLRQKAISRGQSLRVWFSPNADTYWFRDPQTLAWTMYRLPNRVKFGTVNLTGGPYFTDMEPDGSSSGAGLIELRAANGALDSVQIDLSGWVGRP